MIMESHVTYTSSSSSDDSGSVVSNSNNGVVSAEGGGSGGFGSFVGGSNLNNNGARFPFILYQMLEDAEIHGFDDIISWCNHYGSNNTKSVSSGFKVHNRKSFEEDVMGKYFQNQTKYKSFLRQLNLYGFDRVSKGTNRGCMFHSMFVRGEPALCHNIKRPKIPTKRSQEQIKQESSAMMKKMNQGGRRGVPVHQEYNMSSTTTTGEFVSLVDVLDGTSEFSSVHHRRDAASSPSPSSSSNKNAVIELKSNSNIEDNYCGSLAANNNCFSKPTTTTKLLKSMLDPTPRRSFSSTTSVSLRDIDDDIANEIIATFCCPV